ncbi:MAG: type II secretion system protein [Desulfarculus sp.]|nr:type II secretion system protein [Desulfarculus sp.]
MKKNKGFSLIEAVIFIVVVGMAAGVLAFMIGYNAQNGVRNETLTIAGALAEGRMEYIQNLSFSGVAGVARELRAALAAG